MYCYHCCKIGQNLCYTQEQGAVGVLAVVALLPSVKKHRDKVKRCGCAGLIIKTWVCHLSRSEKNNRDKVKRCGCAGLIIKTWVVLSNSHCQAKLVEISHGPTTL